MMVGGAPVNKQ